jgi:hypothetical protein
MQCKNNDKNVLTIINREELEDGSGILLTQVFIKIIIVV